MAAENGTETSLVGFRAELDVFSGPLDLLLHLVKQEEVDIFEVEVARVTDRYLAALEGMELFDVNVAAEFLVVAATLMEIKSKTLLPPGEAEEGEQEGEEDPGVQLVRRLLQYKQFKEAAEQLEERFESQRRRYPRPRPRAASPDFAGPEELLEDLSAWDLMTVFAEIIDQTQLKAPARIVHGETPLSAYIAQVLGFLRSSKGQAWFLELVGQQYSRDRVIGVFLALLELIRSRAIQARQSTDEAADLRIELSPPDEGEEDG
ncbi:MAG: segregation/condensation protein A [Planctomycetes bacterium]|nr:segregation/condensation protein A [Planctomycetota bacterium]